MTKWLRYLPFLLVAAAVLATPHLAAASIACAQADEGNNASLSCPGGSTITGIDFASYGTPDGSCGSFSSSWCDAGGGPVYDCVGSNGCSVWADNDTFGDPCFGTYKRLYYQVQCSNAASIVATWPPAGTPTYNTGTNVYITWSTSGMSAGNNYIHLMLQTSAGSDVIWIATWLAGNSTSYNWAIPSNISNGTYRVKIFDYTGTPVAYSNTFNVTTPDTTAPTVSVTAPTSGATVTGSSVTVSATASDNVGVAGVQFKLDGSNIGSEDTSSPYSITWNSTSATNGSHTITAIARDAASNTTTSTGIPVTVSNVVPDTTAPTVSITAPTSGATVTGSTVTVSANASDNVGVVGVQFKLDGAALGSEDTSSPYSITWNSVNTSNGSHSITATARDAATNSATSAAIPVTVSNSVGPSTSLSGWAWSETFGWISFNSTDIGAGGGPYSVSINSSGDWSGYAWAQTAGWLSFNSAEVSPCGSAGHLNTSTGAVTGWARFISYGGTEGCVELSGTNHTAPSSGGSGGITYDSNSGVFKGWAWGGDTAARTGVGWLQFNASATNPVKCLSTTVCGYTGALDGTCTATTPYQNLSPNTSVTFQASPNGGTSPYHYNWNGAGYDTQTPTNQFTASYSSSAAGPLVVIKDNGNTTTSNISCPAVTVINPIGSSNIHIGRTAAAATLSQLTIKQTNPFAIAWNFTMSSDYSCTASVTPDPNNSSWNTYWKNLTLGVVDNGDGTKTWSGNTSTNLKAGTVAVPITPGIYQFGITCTSSATPTPNPTQGASATLKIDSSQVKEI